MVPEGSRLGLQCGVTLHSGLTPWSYHCAKPDSKVSHRPEHTEKQKGGDAELCCCQKEITHKNVHSIYERSSIAVPFATDQWSFRETQDSFFPNSFKWKM